MTTDAVPSMRQKLREAYARLPFFAQVYLGLVGAGLAFSVVFMLLWLAGACVMTIPWILIFGASLLQQLGL